MHYLHIHKHEIFESCKIYVYELNLKQIQLILSFINLIKKCKQITRSKLSYKTSVKFDSLSYNKEGQARFETGSQKRGRSNSAFWARESLLKTAFSARKMLFSTAFSVLMACWE